VLLPLPILLSVSMMGRAVHANLVMKRTGGGLIPPADLSWIIPLESLGLTRDHRGRILVVSYSP